MAGEEDLIHYSVNYYFIEWIDEQLSDNHFQTTAAVTAGCSGTLPGHIFSAFPFG